MAINAKEKLPDPRIIRVRSEWNDFRIVGIQIIFHNIPEVFGIKLLISDQIVQFADETKEMPYIVREPELPIGMVVSDTT